MKKNLIGAIVGGIIFFIIQSLSWTVLDLHRPAQDYTPNQDTILSLLNASNTKEGGYLLPTTPAGTSSDEMMKKAQANLGKPWARIEYHKNFNTDMNRMMMNMGKGLVFTILMIWLACWIISKFARPTFVNVFSTSLFIGLITYINLPYNEYIWYEIFDAKYYLIDAIAGWGITGVWLGWWMSRRK